MKPTKKKKPAAKVAKKKPAVARKRATAKVDEWGLNPQQRKFADLFLKPMPAATAYLQAGYDADKDVARTLASRLLTNANVIAYIAAERKRMAASNRIEKDEAIGFLVRIIRATPENLRDEEDLAQVVEEDDGVAIKRRVTLPSKLDAIDKLGKMLGWNEPEQVKVAYEVVIGPGGNA